MSDGTRIVLVGKQGAGKGTQAARLAACYEVPHVATGNMFRDAVRRGRELAGEVRRYLEVGELVPDDLVIRVVEQRLDEPDARDGFVLDGFPRTRPQAEALDAVIERRGGLGAVVNLDVPDGVAIQRLSGRRVCRACGTNYHVDRPPRDDWSCDACGGEVVQRDDDTAEAIARRLAAYENDTVPLLGYYEARGLLVAVDGTGTPDEVFARMVAALDRASR